MTNSFWWYDTCVFKLFKGTRSILFKHMVRLATEKNINLIYMENVTNVLSPGMKATMS